MPKQDGRALTPAETDRLQQAQDLVFDAFEAAQPRQQVALARKALALSPFCADAYLVIAQASSLPNEAKLDLLDRAVRAGELALGPGFVEEYAPHFWGILETRPYMRARQAREEAWWALGRGSEAIAELRAMLELNPDDNQGVRYHLACWLASVNDPKGLRALIDRYEDDDSPFFTYPWALTLHQNEGDSPTAREAAKRAAESNEYVPAMLAGLKKPPPEQGYYSPGEPNEAAYVVDALGLAWRAAPGVTDWLLEATGAGNALTRRAAGRHTAAAKKSKSD